MARPHPSVRPWLVGHVCLQLLVVSHATTVEDLPQWWEWNPIVPGRFNHSMHVHAIVEIDGVVQENGLLAAFHGTGNDAELRGVGGPPTRLAAGPYTGNHSFDFIVHEIGRAHV